VTRGSAGVRREPSGDALLVDLGVGLAVLANLLLFTRAAADGRLADGGRLVLAAVVAGVAGVPAARRALGLLRRGILDRDTLAGAAVIACFAAGVLDLVLARGGLPPAWLAAAGVGAASGPGMRGAGFEHAATIAVAALAARVAEAALHRRALREVSARERRRDAAARHLDGTAPSRPDLAAALDAEVRVTVARLAEARVQPALGTWEDAAVRGLLTAALGCASFALVTHGWLGAGPLSPLALFAMAAVLAGVSPSAVLAAAPAARAIAVARARACGVAVKDPAALEALARVDAVCFEIEGPPGPEALAAVRGLSARGVRTRVLGGERRATAARGLGPSEKALAIRDLQFAGSRVLLVGDGRDDPAGATQADVAVAVTPGALPGAAAAPIVISGGRLDDLAGLVDLARALRSVLRQNAAIGAVYNAVLIPAAALGYVSPLRAALLMLAETLLGLANAGRLLHWPAGRRGGA
jgi:cation transport ATPase